jgi:hypothetical protein
MRTRRIIVVALLVLVAGLVALRVALPSIVARELNARLAEMGEYSGWLEEVDLAIWRGAYTLRGLVIEKHGGTVPVPLLVAPEVDISLSWRDLFRGSIVADASFEEPVVHFVDGQEEAESQSGAGVNWRERLEALVPTRIDVVEVRNGIVVFHNFVSDPPVDLEATSVNAVIRNITNVRDAEGRRIAEMDATAIVLDSGQLESEASFDPFGHLDEFRLALRILEIDLTRLNDLAKAYANLDFESGNGEFVMELEATGGELAGYAKPLFQDMEIFSWKSDVEQSDKNLLEVAWEALAEGVTSLLTNPPADQFGTRIEIRGRIDDPEADTFDAIVGILRNAFGEALQPYFEGIRLRAREDE